MLEVAPRLKKLGVSTKIVCTKSTVGNTERISSESIQNILNEISPEYFEVPYVPFPNGLSESPIPMIRTLRKIINAIDFDIIYFANAYALQDLLIYMLKFTHKKPVVSGQHAVLFQESILHDLYVNTIGKALAKSFDAHHVLNTHDMQVFEKWGLKRVHFIPIGVDTQRFTPKRKRDHTKFRVLFVGRLTFQKGVDILCESIEIINKNAIGEDLEFLLVGSGPMESLVRNVTKRYDNVRYLRHATEEVLPKIYRDCDLFVMPSRRETFGIVTLEAQASGLPVIASDIPGPSDVVIDHITGTLIRKESSGALASAVLRYYDLWLRDYSKYCDTCTASRTNASRRYDLKATTSQLYDMLVDVMEQGRI